MREKYDYNRGCYHLHLYDRLISSIKKYLKKCIFSFVLHAYIVLYLLKWL